MVSDHGQPEGIPPSSAPAACPAHSRFLRINENIYNLSGVRITGQE